MTVTARAHAVVWSLRVYFSFKPIHLNGLKTVVGMAGQARTSTGFSKIITTIDRQRSTQDVCREAVS
jgi:hypothetical protein